MTYFDILPSTITVQAWLPVADAVAKATFLLIAASLLSFALRRASAAARHLVWTLALTSALLLPALAITLPRWQLPLVTVTAAAVPPAAPAEAAPAPPLGRASRPAASLPETSTPSPASSERGWSMPSMSWPALILLVWVAGAAAILGRLALGLIAVQWMSRRTERVNDAPWLPLARQLAGELGITPRLLFLRSNRATMPMAWGIFLPSVLMPADADAWPAERLRIVLLHELAHVKRRDCLTHLVAQVACALYWFNPLAWIAARHVRTERERACDDLVLAAGTEGPDYADQLLEIARVMRGGRFPAVLAGASLAMAHRSQLEGRLMAILDPTVPRAGVGRVRAAAATAVFAVALVPLASLQPWVHAAAPAPQAPDELVSLTRDEGQAPAPRPNPAPVPAPRPVEPMTGDIAAVTSGALQAVIPGTVEGALQGTVQGLLQGALQGAIQGGVQGALQGIDARHGIDPNWNVNSNSNEHGQQARKTADPRTVAALTAALSDSDKEVREAAMHALVRMRDPSIFDPLVKALGDASADVREQAVFGLGQLRDRRAVAPLTAALKDQDASVREQAAFALGQLRDRGSVPALGALLNDPSDSVREQAVFALGQLRDPAAVDGLVAALRDAKGNVREQATFALGQIRDRRAVEPLISSLKDGDADVREQAAFALGQIRDERAVEPLIIALKDSVADVREQAAFALGQLRDPRAIDALTAALKDASASVRQQAAFAIGQLAR
jgi:HEAT repeat protein/beta-lactamase regulating signal transducer with metallopeptidase domain